MSRTVSDVWRTDRLWAPFYAFGLNHPPLARLAGAAVFRTDMRLLYDAFSEIAKQPDGATILDVPCGGGVALRGLRPDQDVTYIAGDISPAMLARTAAEATRRRLGQVQTKECDITDLPFGAAHFDLSLCFTGLHCVPDPEAAVAELGRVTKPGGELLGSLWAADVALTQRPLRIAAKTVGLVGPSATQEQLTGWFAAAGFSNSQFTRSGDFLHFRARRR